MKTIKILVANADKRVANLIDSLVRQACDDRAVVAYTRAGRIDEFTRTGMGEQFDLVVVNPENLLPAENRKTTRVFIPEVVTAIKCIKSMRRTPMIAVAVSAQHEVTFVEAGVDVVLGLPFNCDELKAMVRRLLILAPAATMQGSRRPSVFAGLARGWNWLTERANEPTVVQE